MSFGLTEQRMNAFSDAAGGLSTAGLSKPSYRRSTEEGFRPVILRQNKVMMARRAEHRTRSLITKIDWPPQPTRVIMKNLLSIAAITAVILGGAGSEAAELPSYELMGLPITPHQFSVVGSAHVEEQSPSALLTMAGMPASPHQVVVLTPRPRPTEELAATNPIAAASFLNSLKKKPTVQRQRRRHAVGKYQTITCVCARRSFELGGAALEVSALSFTCA